MFFDGGSGDLGGDETVDQTVASINATISWANGAVQRLNLAGNTTVTLRDGVAGSVYYLEVTQDAVGGRTLGGNVKTVNGGGIGLSAGAGAVDMLTILFDGLTYLVLAQSLNLS